ncbi:Afadin and alpha-actinin-binding-domain-containing protein [Paraphysoderma sedebokerense]|nr:Afadin and alpha-actinin-binding-domain-containing protein [Paraphysoderma sedebokerense]
MKNATDYINNELASFGFPSPLKFLNTTEEDASRIVNTMFMMLQQKQKDSDYRDEIEQRYRRLESDYENVVNNMTKVKVKLENTLRERDSLQTKLSASQTTLKKQVDKMRFQTEELKLVKNNLIFTKTQCQHEIRKRERDNLKIKEKLHRLVNDKFKESKISYTVLNPIAPTSRPVRAKNAPIPYQEHEMVMNNFEESQKLVMEENEMLRGMLSEMHKSFNSMKKQLPVKDVPFPSVDDRLFQMPFELSGSAIQEGLSEEMKRLVELWNVAVEMATKKEDTSFKDKEIQDQKKEIKDLTSYIEQLRSTITEQQNVLEMALSADNANKSDADVSMVDVVTSEVETERQKLEQLRSQLEKERKEFTEAAIRMGKERAALVKEKQALEEQKRTWETESLLNALPATPKWLKKSTPAQSTPNLISPTPMINRSEPTTPFNAEYSSVRPQDISPISYSNDEILVETSTLTTPVPVDNRRLRSANANGNGGNSTTASLSVTGSAGLSSAKSTPASTYSGNSSSVLKSALRNASRGKENARNVSEAVTVVDGSANGKKKEVRIFDSPQKKKTVTSSSGGTPQYSVKPAARSSTRTKAGVATTNVNTKGISTGKENGSGMSVSRSGITTRSSNRGVVGSTKRG